MTFMNSNNHKSNFYTSIMNTSFKSLPNLFKFFVNPPLIGVQLSLYNLVYAFL